MVVLLAAPGLGPRLGSTRSGRLRLRWGRSLGARLGGTQDQGDDGQGRRIVRKRTVKGKNHSAPGRQAAFGRVAIGRVATGAGALGALAVGAGAFGALAIGALAIRALARSTRPPRSAAASAALISGTESRLATTAADSSHRATATSVPCSSTRS